VSYYEITENILSSIDEIVYVRDLQKNIIFMNRKAEEITGLSAVESINARKCYDVFSSAGNCRDSCPVDSIIQNQCASDNFFEVVLKSSQGSLKHYKTSASPLVLEGRICGSIVLMRDIDDLKEYEKTYVETIKELKEEISKRKLLEITLSESEEYYRTMFEYTGTAIIVIEEDKTVSMVNREMERLSGYSPREVIGKPWDQLFIHPEDVKKMQKYHDERRQGKNAPTQYEFRIIDKLGVVKKILYTINLVPETNKSIGSLLDISELKKMEMHLRESEEKYRLLIENIEDGYYEVDLEGNLLFCNEALVKIYGGRGKIIGINYKHYTDRENAKLIYKAYNKVFNSGKAEKGFSLNITREDGTIRIVEVSISLIRDGSGVPKGFRGIVRDITERRQAEDRLKYLSMHDVMTGLYNRTYFEEEMSRISRGRFSPVTMICCDVDGLKLVNDTFGHKKGDELLESVAEILKGPFRASDVVARTGGDEFSIILPQTDEKAARRICDRIKQSLKKYNRESSSLPISLSIGMATGNITKKTSCNYLYKQADNDMYRHKMKSRVASQNTLVNSIIETLSGKDLLSRGHAERIYNIACRLAQAANLSPRDLEDIRLLSRYHDIGKAGISDRILFKPGPLNKKEWAEMKLHSEIGFRLARSTPDLSYIAEWILSHHEWWNGRGYPRGLRGYQIPLLSRLFFIMEAYDAMTTDKPYRKAMSHGEAVRELERCSGIQFDPELTRLFIETMSKLVKVKKESPAAENKNRKSQKLKG